MFVLILVLSCIALAAAIVLATTFRRDAVPDEPEPEDPWAPLPYREPQSRGWWPVLAGTWTVMLLAGLGALTWMQLGDDDPLLVLRQQDPETASLPPERSGPPEATPEPYLIEVPLDAAAASDEAAPQEPSAPPSPTPAPTAEPQPRTAPDAEPAPEADAESPPQPATSAGPAVEAQVSCSEGTVRVSYTLRASDGAHLDWYSAYVDGEVVGGGPLGGDTHSGTKETETGSGSHDVEVTATDSRGDREAYRVSVTCS